VDSPERDYFALEAPVVAEIRGRLAELTAAGRDVVLDHELWPKTLVDPPDSREPLRVSLALDFANGPLTPRHWSSICWWQ